MNLILHHFIDRKSQIQLRMSNHLIQYQKHQKPIQFPSPNPNHILVDLNQILHLPLHLGVALVDASQPLSMSKTFT